MSEDPTEFTDDTIETGIVTAAVTDSAELTPEAIQAAKALVNLPEITTVALAQLAREIAQDVGMLSTILSRHKLTQAQYEFLEKHNKFFNSILVSEIKNWQSIKSTEVRLRLQAQAVLEQQMPVIGSRIGNAAEKLGECVEGFKSIARIAGVDAPPAGAAVPGERFQINIDLGSDTRITIGPKVHSPAGTDSDRHEALSNNSQGQRRVGENAKLIGTS